VGILGDTQVRRNPTRVGETPTSVTSGAYRVGGRDRGIHSREQVHDRGEASLWGDFQNLRAKAVQIERVPGAGVMQTMQQHDSGELRTAMSNRGTTRAGRGKEMTKDLGGKAATYHRDRRSPSRLRLRSKPRRMRQGSCGRREKALLWKGHHGVARAIEDLRGVRLLVVPRPDKRGGVLQGV